MPSKIYRLGEYDTDYRIYYVGHKSDTVKIGRRYWEGYTRCVDDFEYLMNRRYTGENLTIFVDTSVKVNAPVEYLSRNGEMIHDSTINYHSFLFTIENISNTTIFLGRTFSVYFIHREAKNKKGEWVKIDKNLSEIGLCLTGAATINLKPGQIVISKIRRCCGNFLTDFRLVFGYDDNVVYSNVFKDSIDARVFDSNK